MNNQTQTKASDLVYLIVQKQLLHELTQNELMKKGKISECIRQAYEDIQTEYDRVQNDIHSLVKELSSEV